MEETSERRRDTVGRRAGSGIEVSGRRKFQGVEERAIQGERDGGGISPS